ncbi:MAG: hypothetical protein R3A48_01205 [Polyangiales bacterium]
MNAATVICAAALLGGCIETAEAQPARRADGGARVVASPPRARPSAAELRRMNRSLIRVLSTPEDAGVMNVLSEQGSIGAFQGGTVGLTLRRDGGVVAPIGALRAAPGLSGALGLGARSGGLGSLGGRAYGIGGLGSGAGQPVLARFDELSITGQAPRDEVRVALTRVSARAQACLTAVRHRLPTDVAVRLTLRSTGRVADVAVRSAPDPVERCLQTALRLFFVRAAQEGTEVSAWFRYRAPGSVEAGRH